MASPATPTLNEGVSGLKPPDCMNNHTAEEFKRWKQRFEIYRKASGAHLKSNDVQIALLLHCMGDTCIDIYNTFNLNSSATYEEVMVKFNNYFVPIKNESVNSHIFFTRDQKEEENFDTYLTELRKMAKECDFGDLTNRLLRDRIVAGISNKRLKDRLLRETDLTLDKTILICKASELAGEQIKQIEKPTEVQVINKDSKHKKKENKFPEERKPGPAYVKKAGPPQTRGNQYAECHKCGFHHERGRCPAYGKKCLKCGKVNHFSRKCRWRPVRAVQTRQQDQDGQYKILPLVNVTSRPMENDGRVGKEDLHSDKATSEDILNSDEEVIAVSITSSVAIGRGNGKLETIDHDDLVAHESASPTPVTAKPETNETGIEIQNLEGANVEFIKQLHSKKEARGTHLLEQVHPFQQQIRTYMANVSEALSENKKENIDVNKIKETKHKVDEPLGYQDKIDDIHEEIDNVPIGRSVASPSSRNYIQGLSQSERGQGPRLTTVSFNIIHDTPKTITNYNEQRKPAEPFPDLQRVYSEPPQIYSEPAKVYSEPAKVYSEPAKIYSEPAKIYSEPAKIYSEPAKIYSEPAKFYSPAASLNLPPHESPIPTPWQDFQTPSSMGTTLEPTTTTEAHDLEHRPESNNEMDEKESSLSDGQKHGAQDSPEDCKDDNCKVGYVVEGRQYRKYRVEERTADGFIVGEYGVVRNEDGALRGVRYTADGAASPRLIHDALLKFLQL